jgi:hypothetical protein
MLGLLSGTRTCLCSRPTPWAGRRHVSSSRYDLIDPRCERGARLQRPNLFTSLRDILAQRGRYVSAALTLVRAWIVAGIAGTPMGP